MEDGIEETAMVVEEEEVGEERGEREVLCPPTTAGVRSPRTATTAREEAVAEVAVERIGEEEASGTAMTGPSLSPGMRELRRSSSTPAMDPLASTSTGESNSVRKGW